MSKLKKVEYLDQDCEELILPSGKRVLFRTVLKGKHLRKIKRAYANVINIGDGKDSTKVSGFDYGKFTDEVFRAFPIFCVGVFDGDTRLDATIEVFDELDIEDARVIEEQLQNRLSDSADKKK